MDSEEVSVRIERGMLDQIDDWRQGETEQPGRPEAIRRLVKKGLSTP